MTDAERALVLLDKTIANLVQLRAQLAGDTEKVRKLDDLIARGRMIAAEGKIDPELVQAVLEETREPLPADTRHHHQTF